MKNTQRATDISATDTDRQLFLAVAIRLVRPGSRQRPLAVQSAVDPWPLGLHNVAISLAWYKKYTNEPKFEFKFC